ncbi:MAG: hypothetical protein AUI14_13410 [Actinobacteria bacterium 13_2_20CM_2_71_6]|nr:MAG: hypothetical protein AUI14_13410 [Actinobacteria bacterium 13_2_20CM_2_71_6]
MRFTQIIRRRYAIRFAFLILAVAALFGVTIAPAGAQTAVPASVAAPRLAGTGICYNAYVGGIGWMGWACDGTVAGTTGRSLSIQAIKIVTTGLNGICARAHKLRFAGWMEQVCAPDDVELMLGSTGRSSPLSALMFDTGSGTLCAQVHMGFIGWMDQVCDRATITVGTPDRALDIQAIWLAV